MRTPVSEPATLPVCQWQIRRPVVTRGAADRDTEDGGIFHRLVEGIERLRGPGILRSTPADRNDGRIARAIVKGGVDRVEKTLVCVRGKIDGDLRPGGDRAGDFNV